MIASTVAVELLRESPELLAVVAVAARLARAWQTSLSWPEYRIFHRIKRVLFPRIHRLAPGRILLVSEKGGRNDAEFIQTVDASVRVVVGILRDAGGSLHLLNSLKRRPDEHGDPLTAAHVLWTHDDGTQTEAYLFKNADESTDLYAHHETSIDDPLGHLTDEQRDGDTRNTLPIELLDPPQ